MDVSEQEPLAHGGPAPDEALPDRAGQRRRLDPAQAWRDPRAARRERSRQEHAGEDAVRALPARRGRDPDQGRGGPPPRPRRRHQARRRHGPPALPTRAGVHGGREHHARRRDAARPVCSTPALRRNGSASCPPVRARRRPERARRGPSGRHAAARRDPQGALPAGRHPDPRRTDGGAHADRDR